MGKDKQVNCGQGHGGAAQRSSLDFVQTEAYRNECYVHFRQLRKRYAGFSSDNPIYSVLASILKLPRVHPITNVKAFSSPPHGVIDRLIEYSYQARNCCTLLRLPTIVSV